ncbi:MAG: YlxR family protein [Clostridiales bacterium]|nr:YlxR family protein [Clostridiales bacterium]
MKRVPMRQCLGCREMKPKNELIRVVRGKEGDISLDLRGKKSGRGAYICPLEACFNKAKKSRAFERALSVEIPDEVYEQLRSELKNETE